MNSGRTSKVSKSLRQTYQQPSLWANKFTFLTFSANNYRHNVRNDSKVFDVSSILRLKSIGPSVPMVRRGFTFEMALQEFFVLWLFAHEKCFVTTKRVRGGGWATLLQQKKYRFIEEQGMGREVKGKENQTKNKRGWEIQANTEKKSDIPKRKFEAEKGLEGGNFFPSMMRYRCIDVIVVFVVTVASLWMNFISFHSGQQRLSQRPLEYSKSMLFFFTRCTSKTETFW